MCFVTNLLLALASTGVLAPDEAGAEQEAKPHVLMVTDVNGETLIVRPEESTLRLTSGKSEYSLQVSRIRSLTVGQNGTAIAEVEGCEPVEGILEGEVRGMTDLGAVKIDAGKIRQLRATDRPKPERAVSFDARAVVVDVTGRRTELSDVTFTEYHGLRLQKGKMKIWVNPLLIKRISVSEDGTATLTMWTDDGHLEGSFVEERARKLTGTSPLGRFAVAYGHVRSIEVLSAPRPLAPAVKSSGATYVVEDSGGVKLTVSHLHYHYTRSGGGGWMNGIYYPGSTYVLRFSYLPLWNTHFYARILLDHVKSVSFHGMAPRGRPLLAVKTAEGSEIVGFLDNGALVWPEVRELRAAIPYGEVVIPFNCVRGLQISGARAQMKSPATGCKGPPMKITSTDGCTWELLKSAPVYWDDGRPEPWDPILTFVSGASTFKVPYDKIASITGLGGAARSGTYSATIRLTTVGGTEKTGTVEVDGNEGVRNPREKFGGPTVWGDLWLEWGYVETATFLHAQEPNGGKQD